MNNCKYNCDGICKHINPDTYKPYNDKCFDDNGTSCSYYKVDITEITTRLQNEIERLKEENKNLKQDNKMNVYKFLIAYICQNDRVMTDVEYATSQEEAVNDFRLKDKTSKILAITIIEKGVKYV